MDDIATPLRVAREERADLLDPSGMPGRIGGPSELPSTPGGRGVPENLRNPGVTYTRPDEPHGELDSHEF